MIFNNETLRFAIKLFLSDQKKCENLYGKIKEWDMSSVTDMSYIFYNALSFNQDISNWDVSSVTNMRGMFCGAEAFNRNISNWDVSSVTDMYGMFWNAKAFNQDISNWDVSSVTNMNNMFLNAHAFNQDISNWRNVSNVIPFHGISVLTDHESNVIPFHWISVLTDHEINVNQSTICSICHDMCEGTLKKTFCNHIFHEECIQQWGNKGKSTCPECRTEHRVYSTSSLTSNDENSTPSLTSNDENAYPDIENFYPEQPPQSNDENSTPSLTSNDENASPDIENAYPEQPPQSCVTDTAYTCCVRAIAYTADTCFVRAIVLLAIVVFVPVFIGSVVTLIVFDIMALIQYSNADITDKCDESNMWIYLLICLILSFNVSEAKTIIVTIIKMNSIETYPENHDNTYYCYLSIFLPMIIWGCVEFWNVGCVNNIENTSIYYMAYIHFVMYLIATASICLTSLIKACA